MPISPEILAARRARVAASLPLNDAVLVVASGQPIPLPENTDQTYPFRAHSLYVYLAGADSPGGLVTFDPQDGARSGWVHFVPTVTEAERVWEGLQQAPGTPLGEFAAWLAPRRKRGVVALGAPQPEFPAIEPLATDVAAALNHARRPKDAAEIMLLREAAAATAAGYALMPELLQPGRTERQVQVELEAAFFRTGADATGYSSIVGTGDHAAILHFSPSARSIQEGDFVLIDAGAEVQRYVCDVTRTYVAGKPTAFQRDLHSLVLGAEINAVARCRPGVEWKDVHLSCAVELVTGLIDLGIMRGHPESLVEQEAHTLFFPHGLGHLVGLGVRDASGGLPGRPRDARACLRTLRCDFPLAEGYVVTVEPGIYFIPALLNDPGRRDRFKDAVNWDAIEPHLALGGVRIEDNILVTADGPENLTAAIPKTL